MFALKHLCISQAAPSITNQPLRRDQVHHKADTHLPQHHGCNDGPHHATTAQGGKNILWYQCIIWVLDVAPLVSSPPVRNAVVLGGLMLKSHPHERSGIKFPSRVFDFNMTGFASRFIL